jgi:uracil-DNA glycosylase family 4
MRGERFIPADGLGTNGIMLIGDSPWKDEVRIGKPFAGAAGSFLNRTLRRLGTERESYTITNAMWCKPPSLDWTDKDPEAAVAIAHCRPHLDELIEKMKPRVLVTMGNVAMQRVLGATGIMNRHSYVHDTPYGIYAVPTFHPSFLMQGNQKLSSAMMFALRRAQDVARSGTYERMPTTYLLDCKLDEAQTYLRVSGTSHSRALQELAPRDSETRALQLLAPRLPLLAVDIETPESGKLDEEEADEAGSSYQILRFSVSVEPGTAMSLPWQEPFITLLKDALERAETVVMWNANFDKPRLEAQGCRFPGQVHDAMWAWHFLQSDLPKGLGFVAPFYYDGPAWKHLNDAQPAFYSAVDSDATIRAYLGIRADLKRQSRWDRYVDHACRAGRILETMGRTGLHVDPDAQRELQTRLQAEYDQAYSRLQEAVPEPVKGTKRWKRKPKNMMGVRAIEDAAGLVPVTVGYERTEPFNPRSSDQVARLIRHHGLKMPMKRGEDRETTEAKYLKRFGKKLPVFKLILEARQRGTMLSTFMWPLDSAGKVHTTYGFHPSTWRKSSRNVNLQNIPSPKHGEERDELARLLRAALVAAPGNVLIAADAAAIEAVLVGVAAGDEKLIRLSKAGVHGYFQSHVMGMPIDPTLPFDELQRECKLMKKRDPVLYDKCKRVIHGTHYGLTPYGMQDEYEEMFPRRKDAEELQNAYLSLFPKLPRWMAATRERASKETYLENHYQYRHYFYDVFSYDWKTGKWVLGGDGKRCIAFIPQSDASAIQTEDLLTLADTPIAPYLRLIIHDEFVLEAPQREAEFVAGVVHAVMTRPRLELGGVQIGCELKIGENLRDMSAWIPKEVAVV